MKCKVLGLLLALQVFFPSAKAQTGKLFNVDNLLPSSFVNQVYQDRDGFVWGVTRNGLGRYDGYQARVFKKERGAGLASNYVNYMIQDRRGLFYFGMYGALQTWDGNEFHDVVVKDLAGTVVPSYITCFACLRSGKVIAGTSGHGLLLIDSPTEAHQIGGELGKLHTVLRILEDREGRLWVVTDNQGLLVLKSDRLEIISNRFPPSLNTSRICEDHKGNIYIGTAGQGVLRLENGEFRHIAATGQKKVTALCVARDGHILIGYDGDGMGILNPETDEVTDNPFYSREVDLTLAKVTCIMEDSVGNIWIGMLQKGIYMQPASTGNFHYMGYKLGTRNTIGQACVTSTLIDSKGRVWVGTDNDGLYLFGSDRQLRHYKQQFPQTVLALMEDRQRRIWLGSYKEGCGWIGTDGTYHRQPLPQGSNVSVFGLAEDVKGRIWLGTMGNGLIGLLPDGKTIVHTMRDGATSDSSMNSLTNDYIIKLSASPDRQRIYVATTMGVCCLDTERDSWTYTFGKNCLNYGTASRIAKEYDQQLWVGTNDGLLCYDLKTKTLDPVGRSASGSSQGEGFVGVAGIERDKQGRLWLATDHGLCCYNPKSGQTESYFVDNGLQSNEFSDGASSTAADGRMIFGGVGGITWFDPLEIHQQQEWNARVKLIGFIVNGLPISSQTHSGSYRVCDTTAIAADHFQLAYQENHFSIQLSTLTYDNPEHITYMYSINGEPYVSLQRGVNEITFTHLAPGTYRFRIKAERNNQQTAEREFTVVVHAPWYRSGWAYCLYLSLLGLAVWLYISSRRRKEKDRLRLQEHIHAEELADTKLRFFMNISHEIRTPMTLILSPLQSLMMSDDDTRRRSVYETIRRNAERILSLINQMMDLRKIDKGMMQMQMQETDLIGFVGDIHELFEHQARTKRINFTYQHDDDTLPVWVDRQQFDKVIVNILSNAFKFTPPGGEIGIRIHRNDSTAVIAVSDNGEQIPEDQLDRIFERFYQSPSNIHNRYSGTGIGLDLTRSLVELHHGTITAQNLTQGCEFIVMLPLGNAHLRPEEMVDEKRNKEYDTNAIDDLDTDAMGSGKQDNHNYQHSPFLISHSSLKLVIAEDDEEIREYLKTELSSDYEVCACCNGREALGEIVRQKPDLVISDVMMPEMDGNTLCATLKGNAQMSHIPVVLLTAKSRDEDKLEGLETGADAYLVKPFNMDILRRTILNLIDSRRRLQFKYGRNDLLEEQVDNIEMRSPDDKLLERIMKVINNNLRNSDLSVDIIASEVGISRVHLHRKMKNLTGQTPHDFIRNLRLKQAANLLSAGDMNVTEVVYACGFSNVTSFSTTFKKFYGMSPREFMQEHHKK